MEGENDFMKATHEMLSDEESYRRKGELLERALATADGMDKASGVSVGSVGPEPGLAPSQPKESYMHGPKLRNCGQIRGGLDELRPFFLIARPGASRQRCKARMSDKSPGIFVVNIVAGRGVCPQTGLLLPVDRCRNPEAMAALEKLRVFTDGADDSDVQKRRAAAQAVLDQEFEGLLCIKRGASLDGCLDLEPSHGLFGLLSEHFEYVEEFMDEAGGSAVPTGFQPFRWRGYGEFMEWFYERVGATFNSWQLCNVSLMFDRATDLVPDFGSTRDEIATPDLKLGRFFRIAPGVPDLEVKVSLQMGLYGWAGLAISVGANEVRVRLSDVYPPFELMFQWVQMVARGDVPAEFEIDEEGTDKRLCALGTDDPDRIWFRVINPYDGMKKVFAEGIVNRRQLVEAFEEELVRFFRSDFDPRHFPEEREVAKLVKARSGSSGEEPGTGGTEAPRSCRLTWLPDL
jgi:hypothetical protein